MRKDLHKLEQVNDRMKLAGKKTNTKMHVYLNEKIVLFEN